jgi:hypothetical protein
MGIYGKTVLLPVPGYSGIRDFFCHNFCLQWDLEHVHNF